MARFSERIGAKAPKTVLQLESMDDDLRNGLWNGCQLAVLKRVGGVRLYVSLDPFVSSFLRVLWADFFKKPLDTIPEEGAEAYSIIRKFFFSCSWSEVYDFVEF